MPDRKSSLTYFLILEKMCLKKTKRSRNTARQCKIRNCVHSVGHSLLLMWMLWWWSKCDIHAAEASLTGHTASGSCSRTPQDSWLGVHVSAAVAAPQPNSIHVTDALIEVGSPGLSLQWSPNCTARFRIQHSVPRSCRTRCC